MPKFLYVQHPQSPPSSGAYTQISTQLGMDCPHWYRQLIDSVNGARISAASQMLKHEAARYEGSNFTDFFWCSHFLSLAAWDSPESVFSTLDLLGSRLPERALPLIEDLGGNLVLFVPSGKSGVFGYWDLQTEEFAKSHRTVREFLGSFYPDDELDLIEIAREIESSVAVDVARITS